ncbi:MAG TPA: hypothetical protein IGS52_14745 [Oscillatoriaceae cyanobacterium M33_DOE_052]|uniref:Uncharacterized protein n=1 Tax=Planktothricoides sp. SpSt-374 TaxID=2282167 RepID=A0A7C3VUB3_9CYAN|nr:hypothetical protein [Oscillatoriaceae cyanobacterium M33_DOE_052]
MGALADNLSIHELSGQKQPRRSQELSQELIKVASENQHRSKSPSFCLTTTLLPAGRWLLTILFGKSYASRRSLGVLR